MPDGTVFDSSLAPIGAYNLAGYKSHCNVVGANGSPLGFLQPDGRVISPQDGANTGFLTPSGTVISETGQFVGVVRMPSMEGLSQDADGIVRDADGNAVGRVCADGTMAMGDPFAIREVSWWTIRSHKLRPGGRTQTSDLAHVLALMFSVFLFHSIALYSK